MSTTYDALGYRFVVRPQRDTSDDAVRHFLSGFVLTEEHRRHSKPAVIDLADGTAEGAVALIGTINLRATGHAEGSLLLHAGAVTREDGAVTMLVGPSGSGKSTLTTELVRRGYRYVTDETVCISPESLRITPFRKPISLKVGSHTAFPDLRPQHDSLGGVSNGQWLLPPADVESDSGPLPRSLTPELIVFPTFHPDAAGEVTPLSPGRAAYQLGLSASFVWSVRGGAVHALARVARRAPAHMLDFCDVRKAADLVEQLMEERA